MLGATCMLVVATGVDAWRFIGAASKPVASECKVMQQDVLVPFSRDFFF